MDTGAGFTGWAGRSNGHTLIELAAVMVILGLIGALAIPRFAHNDATVPAQADQLAALVRQTQAMAMSQGRRLTLDILSTTSYAVTDGVSATPLRDAGGTVLLFNSQNAVSIAGNDITFDSLGRPLNAGSLHTATQTVTLTGAGGTTASVDVWPVTGFVTVTP